MVLKRKILRLNTSNTGFTLIELLIVMAVMAILATIAIFSYSGPQKKARDAQRKSDLKQYQVAIEELANTQNGLYPSPAIKDASGRVKITTELCIPAYFSKVVTYCPDDPKASSTVYYKYISNASDNGNNATDYLLYAKLEAPLTNTWWVICSNGKSGEVLSEPTLVLSVYSCPI